jgi:hypothetical protein
VRVVCVWGACVVAESLSLLNASHTTPSPPSSLPATQGPLRGHTVLAYGYGSAAEAPAPADQIRAVTRVLRAGDVVALPF